MKRNLLHNNTYLGFAIGALLIILIAIQYVKFEYPSFESILSFRIEKYNDKKLQTETELEVSNTNWFPITCHDIDVEITYKKRLIAKMNLPSSVKLSPGNVTTLNVSTTIFIDSLGSDLYDFFMNDSILIVRNSVATVGPFKSKFKRKEEVWVSPLKLLKLLRRGNMDMLDPFISGFRCSRSNEGNINVKATLKCVNIMPLPILINRLNMEVASDRHPDRVIANWTLQKPFLLGVNEKNNLDISFQIPGRSSIEEAISAISDRSDYFVRGNLNFSFDQNELSVPIKWKFTLMPLLNQGNVLFE